jgi:hypothetical protein
MNGGALTNQSHQLFVVGTPYIFVAQSVVVLTPDGETIVVFDTAPGIKGAITCVCHGRRVHAHGKRVLHSGDVRTSRRVAAPAVALLAVSPLLGALRAELGLPPRPPAQAPSPKPELRLVAHNVARVGQRTN